jgi:hypothetical protein
MVERQLHNIERDARRRPEAEARRRSPEEIDEHTRQLVRHREELGEHARQVEMELERIADEGRPEAREKLEVELHAIHERARAIDEELEGLEPRDRDREPGPSRPRDSDPDGRTRILNERLREIRANIAGAERDLRINEDLGGDHAHELKAHIDELHTHLRNTEEELLEVRRQRVEVERERRAQARGRRRDVQAPENERRLESEVVELRGRVDGMHEEMVQMRRLLERLLERRDTEGEVQEMNIEH